MLQVKEIMAAIKELPCREVGALKDWLNETDWQNWDEQIEYDSQSGHLDFLINEALQEKKGSKLKDL